MHKYKHKIGQVLWFKYCSDTPSSWDMLRPRPDRLRVRVISIENGDSIYDYICTFMPPYNGWTTGWGIKERYLQPLAMGPDAYKERNELDLFPMQER